ncbi:hypothetical protein Tco_1422443 [Tanacetum coccineum]
MYKAMTEEDAFLVNNVEGGLCVDYTDAEIAKELWDSLESKYMAEDSLKESLRAQDSDKGKGKKVGRPSVNMTEEAFYVPVDAIAQWIDSGATTHMNRWKRDLYFTWVMNISLLFMAKETYH